MTPAKTDDAALTGNILKALDDLNGPQPGYRPAHAKGILIAGSFTPSPEAVPLTRAPHVTRTSTPVTVRFSNTTGLPRMADNDPQASPRGMAVRFYLADHVHTDIIAHSVNGFPVRTADEFLELLRAIHDSSTTTAKPLPIETFLATHPKALAYVQAPKPVAASFVKESYFAMNAFRFVNARGESRYGRFRVRPEGGSQYLDAAAAEKQSPDFLFEEIRSVLAKGAVRMRVSVQIAAADDVVNDATVQWPADRPEIGFGVIELRNVLPNNDAEQQHIIFDPIPRIDGIEASDDPLLEPRAAVYLASGRRRRAESRA